MIDNVLSSKLCASIYCFFFFARMHLLLIDIERGVQFFIGLNMLIELTKMPIVLYFFLFGCTIKLI